MLMDAPRCRLCGERHWSGEGHRWRDGDVFATGPMANDVANADNTSIVPLKSLGKCSNLRGLDGGVSTYQYRDAEKRRTYQRDLMRKRRAEKRA